MTTIVAQNTGRNDRAAYSFDRNDEKSISIGTVSIRVMKYRNKIVSRMLFVGIISFSRHSRSWPLLNVWFTDWAPSIEQRSFARTDIHLVIVWSIYERCSFRQLLNPNDQIFEKDLGFYDSTACLPPTSSPDLFGLRSFMPNREELLNGVVGSWPITMLSIHRACDFCFFHSDFQLYYRTNGRIEWNFYGFGGAQHHIGERTGFCPSCWFITSWGYKTRNRDRYYRIPIVIE